MAKPAPRCVRCNQKMRNDGTAENPRWVCNNPACVRYAPEENVAQETTDEVIAKNETTTEQEDAEEKTDA